MAETPVLTSEQLPRLRAQQRAFVAHYLTVWNGSEAARRAGYVKNPDIAAARLLANYRVKQVIESRLGELESTARETIVDISRMARGSGRYFIDPDSPDIIDITTPQARANLDLIKAITVDRETRYDKDGQPITRSKVRLEYPDKLAARTVLAKMQGLLRENDKEPAPQSLTVNNVQVLAQQQNVDVAALMTELQNVLAEQSKVIEIESAAMPGAPMLGTGEPTSLVDVSPGVAPSPMTRRVIEDDGEELTGLS